jgi:hypothetical protein
VQEPTPVQGLLINGPYALAYANVSVSRADNPCRDPELFRKVDKSDNIRCATAPIQTGVLVNHGKAVHVSHAVARFPLKVSAVTMRT